MIIVQSVGKKQTLARDENAKWYTVNKTDVKVGYEVSETVNHFSGVVDFQNTIIGHLDSCGFFDDFFIQGLVEPAELLVVSEFPNHVLGGDDVAL